ncbi:MAG: hypothetical protein AAB499_01965 [Patescibacteria group bacterium]
MTKVEVKGFSRPVFRVDEGILRNYLHELEGFAPGREGRRISMGSVVFVGPREFFTGGFYISVRNLGRLLDDFLVGQRCLCLGEQPVTCQLILAKRWLEDPSYACAAVAHLAAHLLLPWVAENDPFNQEETIEAEERVRSFPDNELDPHEVKFFYSADLNWHLPELAIKFALTCGLITATLENNPVAGIFRQKDWENLIQGRVDPLDEPWTKLTCGQSCSVAAF